MMLLGLVLATFAFLLGYSLGTRQSTQQKNADYQQAVEEMKSKLDAAGLLPRTPGTNTISGTVTVVSDNALDIDAEQVTVNPLDEPAPIQRHVSINAETKITRFISRSEEEINADLAEFEAAQKKFNQAVRAGKLGEPPVPPISTVSEDIRLSDIKKGEQVTVTAADNITYAAEFVAATITVVTEAAPPAADTIPSEPTPPPAP